MPEPLSPTFSCPDDAHREPAPSIVTVRIGVDELFPRAIATVPFVVSVPPVSMRRPPPRSLPNSPSKSWFTVALLPLPLIVAVPAVLIVALSLRVGVPFGVQLVGVNQSAVELAELNLYVTWPDADSISASREANAKATRAIDELRGGFITSNGVVEGGFCSSKQYTDIGILRTITAFDAV